MRQSRLHETDTFRRLRQAPKRQSRSHGPSVDSALPSVAGLAESATAADPRSPARAANYLHIDSFKSEEAYRKYIKVRQRSGPLIPDQRTLQCFRGLLPTLGHPSARPIRQTLRRLCSARGCKSATDPCTPARSTTSLLTVYKITSDST